MEYRVKGSPAKSKRPPELKPGQELEQTTNSVQTEREWRYSWDLKDKIRFFFSFGTNRKSEEWYRYRTVRTIKVYDFNGNLIDEREEYGEWSPWLPSGRLQVSKGWQGEGPGDKSTDDFTINLGLTWYLPDTKSKEVPQPDEIPPQPEEEPPEKQQELEESREPETETAEQGKGEEDSWEFRFFGFIEDVGDDQDISNEPDSGWLTPKVAQYQEDKMKRWSKAAAGEVLSVQQVLSMSQHNKYVPNVDLRRGPDKTRQLVGWKIVAVNWAYDGDKTWRGLGHLSKTLNKDDSPVVVGVTYGWWRTRLQPLYADEQ